MAQMDIQEIREILPHRYPMLLVDRILEMTDEKVIGIKNVSANEPFFAGHFPEFSVMPGVLIVESMAQVGGVLVSKVLGALGKRIVLLASIEEAKFRKPVVPGDQLRIEMTIIRRKATIAKMQGVATVDGSVVAEAIVMCKFAEKPTPLSTQSTEVAEPQLA
jgi:3-hydroxyacyl-[acyl-carrier-protein] dehydratase